MTETWKALAGFPAYEGSTTGQIRNAATKCIRSLTIQKDGYEYVTMRRDGKYWSRSIHRLIALTFIDNPDNLPTVNHKNWDRTDNNVDNLEWASRSNQVLHQPRPRNRSKGSSRPVWKCDVLTRERLFMYGSVRDAAEAMGTKHNSVITSNMSSAFGYLWCYDEDCIEGEEWSGLDRTKLYVSSFGRVRADSGRLITGSKDRNGYVYLHVAGQRCLLHRVVAQVFLETWFGACVVNHKDGNRANNKMDNLECVTQSCNVLHAYRSGVRQRKRTIWQVDDECNIVDDFDSVEQAIRKTKIGKRAIVSSIENEKDAAGYMWFEKKEKMEKAQALLIMKTTVFKVFQVDKESSKLVGTYLSYPEAELKTGVGKTNIYHAVKSGTTAGGFCWFKNRASYEAFLSK